MTFDIREDLRIQYFDAELEEYVNITCDSYQIETDRGIEIENNVFARPKIGTATVSLLKSDLYDLLNPTGPPYKSNDLFRVQVYISGLSFWINLFSGVIQNVQMTYEQNSKKLAVTIVANDYIKIAMNTRINTFNIVSGNRSYTNVMNQLGTAITAIDSRFAISKRGTASSSTFQYANTYLDSYSGELFAQFLDAELGWMYADRDNVVEYMARGDIAALQAVPFDFTGEVVSNVHSTSANHICMTHFDLKYNSDEMVNRVKVTEVFSGAIRTSANTASVNNFGSQLQDFEVNFDPTASGGTTLTQWATEVSTNASNPRKLTSVTVPVIRDNGEMSNIITQEIGGLLKTAFVQGPDFFKDISLISNLQHSITPDYWELTIGLWRGV
jgi:hypothetical protein